MTTSLFTSHILLFTLWGRLPATASLPRRLRVLDGTRPEANNEADEQVRIVESALQGGAVARFGLPPRSLAVLLP